MFGKNREVAGRNIDTENTKCIVSNYLNITLPKLNFLNLAGIISCELPGCVNGGSGILFGFYRPERYSERRVKTPKLK